MARPVAALLASARVSVGFDYAAWADRGRPVRAALRSQRPTWAAYNEDPGTRLVIDLLDRSLVERIASAVEQVTGSTAAGEEVVHTFARSVAEWVGETNMTAQRLAREAVLHATTLSVEDRQCSRCARVVPFLAWVGSEPGDHVVIGLGPLQMGARAGDDGTTYIVTAERTATIPFCRDLTYEAIRVSR